MSVCIFLAITLGLLLTVIILYQGLGFGIGRNRLRVFRHPQPPTRSRVSRAGYRKAPSRLSRMGTIEEVNLTSSPHCIHPPHVLIVVSPVNFVCRHKLVHKKVKFYHVGLVTIPYVVLWIEEHTFLNLKLQEKIT